MNILLPAFKIVSVVFAGSAIVTGMQAIIDPVGFSRSFGIPFPIVTGEDDTKSQTITRSSKQNNDPAISYVSLMGVRQLATGIILFIFAWQRKWTDMATILSILGIVVAGTDGFYLSRTGARNLAKLHAVPGGLIALLASTILLKRS